ncbi:MAG: hypothetical protein LH606_16280 [Cytophagaceae bacterium]|nr:hypothetical protein [Cytophagaceae bacterium]
MLRLRSALSLFLLLSTIVPPVQAQSRVDSIPLPEHPRPDFERARWLNRYPLDPTVVLVLK